MFDITAYIESGTIEACLLGQSSPAELAEMERLAAEHPEIAAEVAAVRTALERLALTAATPPPPALKARILAAASAAVPAVKAPAPTTPAPQAPAPVMAPAPAWPIWLAVVALLACALTTYLYIREARANQTLTAQHADLEADFKALALNADSLGLALSEQADAYDALAMRCSRAIELKGLAPAPEARAFVYWHEHDGSVRAQVEHLPAPPAGKAYQLWAIVDGKPFDLGMLLLNGDSLPLTRMPKPVRGATAFAVTLEKAEGVPQPEGEMYVMGAV